MRPPCTYLSTFHPKKKGGSDHPCHTGPEATGTICTSALSSSGPSPSSTSTNTTAPSRKRPALDTTGFRPVEFRDVVSRVDDIDSDLSDLECPSPPPLNASTPQAPPTFSLRPSVLNGVSANPLATGQGGQAQLQGCLNPPLSAQGQPLPAAQPGIQPVFQSGTPGQIQSLPTAPQPGTQPAFQSSTLWSAQSQTISAGQTAPQTAAQVATKQPGLLAPLKPFVLPHFLLVTAS